LKVRVAAAPVDGEANAALIRLLATELHVARGDVRIVLGASGRDKLVEVDRVDPSVVRARWHGLDV